MVDGGLEREHLWYKVISVKGWLPVTPLLFKQWRLVVYLGGGLETAGLISTGLQTDVQNVPVDLQIVALSLLDTLEWSYCLMPVGGSTILPGSLLFWAVLSE